jgi:hypothetical protein
MWTIFLNIIISIIIIYLGHQLWNYLRDKYSNKITKDLVSSQTQKYKKMMEELQTYEKEIPDKIEDKMEDELLSYIDTI